jgi:hypothetical protein
MILDGEGFYARCPELQDRSQGARWTAIHSNALIANDFETFADIEGLAPSTLDRIRLQDDEGSSPTHRLR